MRYGTRCIIWDQSNRFVLLSDGACSRDLSQAMRMLGVTSDDFEMMYESIDQNENGTIDKKEFAKWWIGTNSDVAERAAYGLHPLSNDL